MNNFTDELKIRLWYPSVKQMRHFSGRKVEHMDGRWGIFLPVEEGSVIIQTGVSMRFTGKKDSKGEDLYESDIIRGDNGVLMVIRYGLYSAYCPTDKAWMDSVGFYAKTVNYDYPPMPLGPTEDYAEWVGNIYENPELMNGSVLDNYC